MALIITIKTDNSAFRDDNYYPEIARILESLVENARAGSITLTNPLRDINGNVVGDVRITN